MCIFCMLSLMMIGTSITSIVLNNIELRLNNQLHDVQRSLDTESTTLWRATTEFKGRGNQTRHIPVAIHLYKQHHRARVQILTHDITRQEAEKVQDIICKVLEARVISRHFPKLGDHDHSMQPQASVIQRNKVENSKK